MITGLRNTGYRFSKPEIRELMKAWVVLSLAFAIMFNPGNLLSMAAAVSFIFSGLTVGVGFLLHELGHKFVAQKYGLWAEFRADNKGLIIALGMAVLFNWFFAAPGAVNIHGFPTKKQMGHIATAGPLVNYVLAVLFFVVGLVNPVVAIAPLFYYGAIVNAFLGLFNMIPFGMFDGRKILSWNKLNYGLMLVGGFVLLWFTWL